jgi:hypothetical protein
MQAEQWITPVGNIPCKSAPHTSRRVMFDTSPVTPIFPSVVMNFQACMMLSPGFWPSRAGQAADSPSESRLVDRGETVETGAG